MRQPFPKKLIYQLKYVNGLNLSTFTRISSLQRSATSVNGGELNGIANANASERDTEVNIEASGAANVVTESEAAAGGTPPTRVKRAKKKTSPIWKHFTEVFVEEKVDDMVIKKPMAACKYCDDVLSSQSNQGTTRLWNHYHSFHDEKMRNLA